MARLATHPIGREDLQSFLDTSSDFAFELRVLKLMSDFGWSCEHSGTYADSVTNKIRQFDIRAWATTPEWRIGLAIETKNIGDFYPLLVQCVPRLSPESQHHLLGYSPGKQFNWFDQATCPIRMRSKHSCYPEGGPVGKACVQVGRTLESLPTEKNPSRKAEYQGADDETFDKCSQAISSASEMITSLPPIDYDLKVEMFTTAVLPMLVVPDNRLWIVEYDEHGAQKGPPIETNHCSLYVDRKVRYESPLGGYRFRITHLEIVTVSGLVDFVRLSRIGDGRIHEMKIEMSRKHLRKKQASEPSSKAVPLDVRLFNGAGISEATEKFRK